MADALIACLEHGQHALDEGRTDAAIQAFREAHQLAPDQLGIVLALAYAYRLADDVLTARETLVAASRRRPTTDATLDFQFGAALLEVGAAREAAASFARVMRANPSDPAPIGAQAGARRAVGDLDAAWALIIEALRRAPEQPAFLLTAAQIRHDMGDADGALSYLDQAERIRPHHPTTRLQRAYTTLLQGPSIAAWELFEARALPRPATNARPWNGESLDGASILVAAEQGIGDQLQFARFIRLLHAFEPSRIVVECHPQLVSLFRAPDIEIVERGNAPETDWYVPLLSLPHRLQLGHRIDGVVPYMMFGNFSAPRLALDVPALPLHLGLVWAGNPAFAGHATRDFERALLPALSRLDFVKWHALQQGEALPDTLENIVRAPVLTDWQHTARALLQLDGIVTTDTGIAHLAAGLGLPTWVLLQHVPDWRWGMHDGAWPWYPSARLLRQTTPGNWSSVVEQLGTSLADFAMQRKSERGQ